MSALASWVERRTGRKPADLDLFQRAFTHSSWGEDHYERLEFLGDRVLGLTMASWLFELYPEEPEGKLSRRFNALVSGETCAEIARELDFMPLMRLGKQARDDGAKESENVLGDMVEALIGAIYIDAGFDAAASFVRACWSARVETQETAPKHPKSALQEWAAANNRKAPVYRVADRSGPQHAPHFLIEVSINGVGEATGRGTNKQEAEREAATALLERLK